ncbi:MAG TPA: SufBD protein [Bacilli bacterium]|jgi:hypothetical protein|nr:SufBD protein [Bacilli bacterium]
MKEIIIALQDKDDKKAYELSKVISAKSAESDEFYTYFDDFIDLLIHPSSYVRTRGFCLACAQARWDTKDKLKNNLDLMLKMLHDDKPTAVRQCLAALHGVILFKPELCKVIRQELKKIDLSKYKDTMAPLIKKDIDALVKMIE